LVNKVIGKNVNGVVLIFLRSEREVKDKDIDLLIEKSRENLIQAIFISRRNLA